MVEMKTGKIRRVTSRIFAVILLILQGAVLDFYLAREKETQLDCVDCNRCVCVGSLGLRSCIFIQKKEKLRNRKLSQR